VFAGSQLGREEKCVRTRLVCLPGAVRMRRCMAKIGNGSTNVLKIPSAQGVLALCVAGQYSTTVGGAESGPKLSLQSPSSASTLRRVPTRKDGVKHGQTLTLNFGQLCWKRWSSARSAAGEFVSIPDETTGKSFLSRHSLSVFASV
jgi:hypothetical protein